MKDIAIKELRRKLEIAQKEKDSIQLTVDKLENASKSLNKLIDCQIVENCLDEFVDNPKVSDNEKDEVTVKPSVVKREFVKPRQQEKTARKTIQVSDGLGLQKKLIFLPNVPGNPQIDLQDKRVIDSGCSRHMIGTYHILHTMKKLMEDMLLLEGIPEEGKSKEKVLLKLFCKMKGILRQFSVARTPQQNAVAERRNRTLIEATRTMLADSKLPTTFWVEEVNTACYVQNKVLVVKPHNKTPYELFHGRTPTLSFMRPFGCHATILNTLDYFGKFDGKANEGFFVRYYLNSKAFSVFNSRKRIVEENLNIRFSESTPNVLGSGPDWLFDIDALTRTMNYEPIVADTQSNDFAGTKASDNASQARKETEPVKDYYLLPLWTVDPPFPQDPKCSHHDGFKPLSDDGKKVDEVPRKRNDPNMPTLEDVSIFNFSNDDEDDDVVADMNNLDTTIQVSPIPTTRIYKDHLLNQVIRDLHSTTQTRQMSKNLEEHGFASEVKNTSTPIETQNSLLKDEDVKEVDVYMSRSMIGSLMYLTSSRPDILFLVCACARYQVNPKVSHLHAVKRIFSDSDYDEASLDRKSTIGGCHYLGCRLISWQCKKQTMVANFTTKA
nr:hypothetical protein [Tanacetum cinerariifolium]